MVRYFFFSVIVSLISLALWPWIKQFLLWLKSRYTLASTPEEEAPINEEKDSEHEQHE